MTHKPSSVQTRGPTGRGAHSGYEALARGLGWFSIGLGLAELLATKPLCRALGLEHRETLIRCYGGRELATGVAILMSHDPTPWIWGRVAGDALDLVTLSAGSEGGPAQKQNLTAALVAVAGATALDIYCAQGLTADKRLAPPGRFDYGERVGFPDAPSTMRGAASDATPHDYRIPEALRPWDHDKSGLAKRAKPGQRVADPVGSPVMS